MHEVEPDKQFDRTEELAPVLVSGPSETELVMIALLMRIYDVNSAILAALDEGKANQVYEAHERGENFNPPVFIPDVQE